MLLVCVGILLLLILIVIAVKVGAAKQHSLPEPRPQRVIHTSGEYSVIRTPVRQTVLAAKPTEEEIRKYLAGRNEDTTGAVLSDDDKEHLIRAFRAVLDSSIAEIEAGDRENVEFYYYDYEWNDPGCRGFIAGGHFVNREQIHRYPGLVPPFHLGCGCRIKRQHVTDSIRKTIALNMRPLLTDNGAPPTLPNWHTIYRLNRE